ncbi:transcription factor [Fusarium albosuccineum]|uniref:Transcription factor n=1 Tax=Fusarium albosuccineum TaxID=1237068 RepID=A0A8H4P7Z1_9HYPO|nr:transcription factor [Fusarium albosuccineum]
MVHFVTTNLSKDSPPGETKSRGPKLTRTSTHKVRTGCITCKKRHIKCDEAKPACGNCKRSKRGCEGYFDQLSKPPKPWAPVQLRWDTKQITRAAPPITQLLLNQDSPDFQDARSVIYFQQFVDLSQAPWIAAGSNHALWSVTLPQVARNNTAVRHAAIGVGALSTWLSESNQESFNSIKVPDRVATDQDAHYFRAVSHYCHALKLQSQNASMQDTMFLSILFLCFEILRGNRKAALDHVNHSLAILLGLLTDLDSPHQVAALAPNPKPLLAVLSDIFFYLLGQARTVLRGTLKKEQPLPHFTKALRDRNFTIISFMELVNQLPWGPASRNQLPPVFTSLDEFEQYWATSMRSRAEIGPVLANVVENSGVLKHECQDDIVEFWSVLTGDSRVIKFCDASTREMQAVEAAFLPLFNRIMTSEADSPAYERAIQLRLQYLGIYAFGSLIEYHQIDRLHKQTPLLREYLSLAGLALRTARRKLKNPAQQFSLQGVLSWYILLIALYCRDPVVREEATWMLKDYPCQDGLWNARALFILALKNRELERVNATEGTPQEQWYRLLRREYLFEDGGDRVVLCYLDKNEETGGWNLVEETTQVEGDPENVRWVRRPLTASGKLLGQKNESDGGKAMPRQ